VHDVVGVQPPVPGAAGEPAPLAIEGAEQLPQRQARLAGGAALVVHCQIAGGEGLEANRAAAARQALQHGDQRAGRQQLPVAQPPPARQRVDLRGQRRPPLPGRGHVTRVQGGAGQLDERLRKRRALWTTRFRGNVRTRPGRGGRALRWTTRFRGNVRRLPVQPGAHLLQARVDHRGLLGRDDDPVDHVAVRVVRPGGLHAPRGPLRIGGVLIDLARPAHSPDQLLQLPARRAPGRIHPRPLLLGGHDPRDRPHLRVRQPPGAELLLHQRQRAQRPRHPHLLPSRRRAQRGPPRQPVRAREQPNPTPGLAGVELTDQRQQLGLTRRDTTRPRDDPVRQIGIRHARK
jgi:hypothetical protein